MHTNYYVNGKKTDLGSYLSASNWNDYRKAVFEKAKKYYNDHPEEWAIICSHATKETLIFWMMDAYENTDEGKAYKEQWEANKEKIVHNQAKSGFFIYGAIILGSIIGAICLLS